MQSSTTFPVAALSSIAFAIPQAAPTDWPEASAIPTCGASCLTSAAAAIGCSDIPCQCSSSAQIQASAINCVLGNCGLAQALSVQAATTAVCTTCAS